MISLKTDLSNVIDFTGRDEVYALEKELKTHLSDIYNKTGKGNDYLGWVDLPGTIPGELVDDIINEAERIRSIAEIMVVIGIGGSYLGSRAVIEALGNQFYDLKQKRDYPYVLFAGQNIGEDYLAEMLEILDDKDYAITVISKSGTTTEPAIAFRILKMHLENKYGTEGAKKRIIAITDKEKGALKKLSVNEGYKTYVVPDDVGGRYSVLTPVGLFPVAVAGFDIKKILEGAKRFMDYMKNYPEMDNNPAFLYAASRNILYRKGFKIEILANYLPSLFYFTEWWKQLYGESEGKEGKGIFPAGVSFTTDLHSMGQYIQDGLRNIFETVISVENPKHELRIPKDDQNLDKLNYLAGKRIQYVNSMAETGTRLAHVDGGVPNIRISVPGFNEQSIGELIYFFEISCALSGYVLGVNPFDQPGVEAYKKNMFALLGKPGFESETEEIRKRL